MSKNIPSTKDVKPFMVDGEPYAEICRLGSETGKFVVDINLDTFNSRDARRLAKWLNKAADWVSQNNRKVGGK